MKNFNLKKSLITLILGLALVLSAIPTNLNKLFPSASAEIKNGYNTPTKIDVNGKFEESTSAPSKWSVVAKYEDIDTVDGEDDKDSTSYSGIVPTSMAGWNTYYKGLVHDWLENWDKSHEFSLAHKEDLHQEITKYLVETNPYILNPLVHGYDANNNDENKVLALIAGSTFTKYMSADESEVQLDSQPRKAFITYKSNSYKLDQYSFYKITFYVKTVNGAKANVTLSGDIEKDAFMNFETAASSPVPYYLYTFTDGTNTTKFYSTTEFNSPTLSYNGKDYHLDGSVYKPDDNTAGYEIVYSDDIVYASTEGWEQKTIYISTTTEASINLNLMLGDEENYSTGNVFFDDVEITKIQLRDFYDNAVSTSSSIIIDKREILKSNQNNTDSRNYTVLENFEDKNNISWTAKNVDYEKVDISAVPESNATGYMETFPYDNATNKNLILKVSAHDGTDIVLNSDKITLEQGRYHRISFWATSTESASQLTVEFIGTKANDSTTSSKDSTKPYVSERKEETPSNVNNFWVNYVFYVRSTAEKATEAYIKINITKNQTIYFDNLVIETISKKEFDDTSYNKLNLATEFKDQVIKNGNFFEYDSVDVENYTRPLPPSSWVNIKEADVYEYYEQPTSNKFTKAFLEDSSELTFNAEKTTITYEGKEYVKAEDSNAYNYKEDGKIVSKFVFMKDQKFNYDVNKSAYYNKTHDLEIATTIVAGVVNGPTKASNTLTITASSSESTAYESDIIKLSSTNSLYIIAIDVKTTIAARANVKLVDKNDKVYAMMNDISTYNQGSSEWQTIKFYVNTGSETAELFLNLEFAESVGTVEFKNIYAIKTSSTNILDNKLNKTHEELAEEKIRIVNLAKETFIEHSDNLNSTTHLFDANLYEQAELTGKTSGIFGILDTTAPHSDYASISAKDSDASPYVLIIKNDAGECTQLDALKSFTVEKSKALQITITARVEGLSEGKFATISFGDLNAVFEIKNNEFTEYTLYVDNIDAEIASIVKYYISMLDTAGTLVVDNITVTSLTNLNDAESKYPDGDTETVKFVKTTTSKTEDEKEETKDDLTAEEENNTLEIFLAVFSSLLLAASIVFAIAYTRFKALHKPRKRAEKNLVSETDDGQRGFI